MRHASGAIILIIASLALSGCATTSTATAPVPQYPAHPPIQQQLNGVYHTVLRGQTLWRIAKAYNVDIVEITQINGITDPAKIETGQSIFIPGATGNMDVELKAPFSKSRKGYIWPAEGRIISYYGSQQDGVTNKGIDIEAREGQPIYAARSGKVVFCDDKVKGLGKVVIIDHGDGYSTLYGHNSAILVKCGDYTKQGQEIARAGKTGRTPVAALHFQIRKGHKPQNPFYYLP